MRSSPSEAPRKGAGRGVAAGRSQRRDGRYAGAGGVLWTVERDCRDERHEAIAEGDPAISGAGREAAWPVFTRRTVQPPGRALAGL